MVVGVVVRREVAKFATAWEKENWFPWWAWRGPDAS